MKAGFLERLAAVEAERDRLLAFVRDVASGQIKDGWSSAVVLPNVIVVRARALLDEIGEHCKICENLDDPEYTEHVKLHHRGDKS